MIKILESVCISKKVDYETIDPYSTDMVDLDSGIVVTEIKMSFSYDIKDWFAVQKLENAIQEFVAESRESRKEPPFPLDPTDKNTVDK